MKKFNLTPNIETTVPAVSTAPSLFEINQALDYLSSEDNRYVGIKGEHLARMVIFTNFVLGRKPILLKGSRSSGKTLLMNVLLTLCPNPLIVSTSSDKADFHDADKLNTASHFIIPEINKVNDAVIEILKDMGEGAATTYKFTDYSRVTKEIVIDPKPFITSIADENKNQNRLGEELLSRLTVVHTDSSVQQNVMVIEEKLKKAQDPYTQQTITTERMHELKTYVKSLPPINQYTFIYLPGKSVIDAIPPQFTDSRRDTDKYIDNTKGIALFHVGDRSIVEKNKRKNILVAPVDAWHNHIIYNEILLQSALKAGPVERRILQIIRDGGNILMTVSEIRNTILNMGATPSHETVRKACDNLAEIGYLTRTEDTRPFKYSLTDAIQSSYTGYIDWHKVVDECKRAATKQFPIQAPDYIKRFCGDSIWATHPFTGERVNILEYEEAVPVKKKDVVSNLSKTQSLPQKELAPGLDPIELLRQKIIDLLRKNDELTFENLVTEIRIDMSYEEDEIEKELNYLSAMKELIYKNGKAKILE
ncbi:MAG: hypothetical protein Q8O88_01095 [bacterium]|nr:hypothetical protein [bacterium]